MNNQFLQENEYYSKKFSPELYLHGTAWPIRFIEHRRIKKITKLINPENSDKILDIGCGAGDIIIDLQKYYCKGNEFELFGIDASRYMVERTIKRTGITDKISTAASEDLPFKNNFFNKIICSEVLEHVEDIDKTVSEISRVLAREGTFVISYPNEDLINQIKKGINLFHLKKIFFPGGYQPENYMADHWHKRKITFKYLLKIFAKYKLKISKVFYIPGIFPVRYIVYGTK